MKRMDFRSDTVTYPTPEMREAIAAAEVGDDVYQDDPTTNRLEELAAASFPGRCGSHARVLDGSNIAMVITRPPMMRFVIPLCWTMSH